MWSACPVSDGSIGPNALIRFAETDFPICGWRPRGLIAKTATSEVFLLENAQGHRAVGKCLLPAVALCRPRLIDDEYATLKRLADPAVVRVLGRTNHAQVSWLVLEHLQYGDLRSLAGAPPEFWLPLLVPAARWLAHLHSAGFAYGDVKTSHIMLRQPSQACFIDLATVAPLGSRIQTRTPATAPPEVETNVTAAADVFAFGVMLYELLFAELPDAGAANHSLCNHEQLVNLSLTCRAPEPSHRPSMAAVFRRLRELHGRANTGTLVN